MSNRSYAAVPVAEIRSLHDDVERTHDAYWSADYDHASVLATLRRNDWIRAVRAFEQALKTHALALLEAYEMQHKIG